MPFLLTIIEQPDTCESDLPVTIEHLKLRLTGPLDIPHIVAVLSTPPPVPRKRRSDAREPRRKGSKEPQLS